ncbi:mycothiol transferase [Streptomyces sp. KR80]|uniref:mycothiol transferase n=1 Tax=Streptomyces sp. KR80 TaxID=3457426 RepID=UPI003FD1A10D
MNAADVLADAFGRVQEVVHEAVEGLTAEDLNARLDLGANSIAWLVWHLTRIQDDHVADASNQEQVWLSQDWVARFDLPFASEATGYGHSSKQVAQVRVDAPELLLGYFDAVHEQTMDFVRGLKGTALNRVVDDSWSPPVTLGVRLVSVIADDLQHAGQAAFVRGSLERRRTKRPHAT